MVTIEKVGGQGAGSGRKKERFLFPSGLDSARPWSHSLLSSCWSLILLVTDPACRLPAFFDCPQWPRSWNRLQVSQCSYFYFPTSSFRLGCPNFTYPNFEPTPVGGTSCSLFFPDQAIYQGHPRFRYAGYMYHHTKNCVKSIILLSLSAFLCWIRH